MDNDFNIKKEYEDLRTIIPRDILLTPRAAKLSLNTRAGKVCGNDQFLKTWPNL